MRYFTRGWLSGEYSDGDYELAVAEYNKRLEAIRPALSPEVVTLAETSLHDGVIVSVEWDPAKTQLKLSLVIGDLQRGYTGLDLAYEGAMLGDQRLEVLRELGRDRRAELLYDEIDVDDRGIFQHRMIFWPTREVTVDFAALTLAVRPRSDRRLEPGDAFHLVEDDD